MRIVRYQFNSPTPATDPVVITAGTKVTFGVIVELDDTEKAMFGSVLCCTEIKMRGTNPNGGYINLVSYSTSNRPLLMIDEYTFAANVPTTAVNNINLATIDDIKICVGVWTQTTSGTIHNSRRAICDVDGAVYFKYLPSFARALDIVRSENGVENDEGVKLLIKDLALSVNTPEYAATEYEHLKLYYAEGDTTPTESSSVVDLDSYCATARSTGIVNNAEIMSGDEYVFSNGSNWNLMLVYSIKSSLTTTVEKFVYKFSIPRAFANVHLSSALNGGVCFGGFSSSTDTDPLFECNYPAIFYKGIAGLDGGKVTGSGNLSGGSYREMDVEFHKTFSTPPVVVAGFDTNSTAGNFGRCCCSVTSVTTTGFKLKFFNGDSSARNPNFTWIAFGLS